MMKKRKSKSYVDLEPLTPLLGSYPREKKQDELISAWGSRNLKKFTAVLNDSWGDFDAVYKDLSYLRILDILAKEVGSDDYLKEFAHKAPKTLNTKNHVTGRAAIHYAAEIGNAAAVAILLADGADGNIQDCNGDTALHSLIKRWEPGNQNYMGCLEILLAWLDIALNVPNSEGCTPIHLAAAMSEQSIVNKILESGENLDLDTFRFSEDNKTARDVLLKNFPDLEDDLPGTWIPNPYKSTDFQFRLFYYLKTGQELRFCNIIREALNNECSKLHALLECIDGQCYTYLHRACERGFTKAVKILIKLGVNVNRTLCKIDPPIVLAARNGHHEILTILLAVKGIDVGPDENGDTLLHIVVQPRNITSSSSDCLRKLLSHHEIDVNGCDCKGRTALHTAARNLDEQSIFTLLDNGAQIDIADNFGETPLNLISEGILRKYLDSKVTANDLPAKDREFSISLNYPWVDNKTDHIYSISTELLCNISKSDELKKLLAHPMYSTVIFLKWKRIRMFFYLYLFFYSIFCFLTTAYIFFGRAVNTPNSLNCTSSANLSDSEIDVGLPLVLPCNLNSYYQFAAKIFIVIGIIILTITEFTQIIAGFKRYMRSLENWLQLAVIIFSTAVISSDCALSSEPSTVCSELCAVTILLIWLEFFFVIGNHPKLTFFIDIFREASFFLFQFLAVHTTLILGFALSFHMLFRDENGPFSTMHDSFFKTLIMITGELDVGEIPLNSFPIVSHIMFASFIFLITIVLFNLLIGLAVSATKPIEDNAFLHRCISQVPIISCFEDMYFNDLFVLKKLLLTFSACCKSNKKSPLGNAASPVLYVFPNLKNRMQIQFVTKHSGTNEAYENILHLHHHLSKTIMDDLQIIIANKQDLQTTNCDKIDELKLQLERVHANLDEELRIMKTALVEIMEQLKDDGEGDGQGAGHKKKKKRAEILMKKLKTPVKKFDQHFSISTKFNE